MSEYYISLGLFARLSAIRQRAPRNSFDNNFHGRDEVPESGNLNNVSFENANAKDKSYITRDHLVATTEKLQRNSLETSQLRCFSRISPY